MIGGNDTHIPSVACTCKLHVLLSRRTPGSFSSSRWPVTRGNPLSIFNSYVHHRRRTFPFHFVFTFCFFSRRKRTCNSRISFTKDGRLVARSTENFIHVQWLSCAELSSRSMLKKLLDCDKNLLMFLLLTKWNKCYNVSRDNYFNNIVLEIFLQQIISSRDISSTP